MGARCFLFAQVGSSMALLGSYARPVHSDVFVALFIFFDLLFNLNVVCSSLFFCFLLMSLFFCEN